MDAITSDKENYLREFAERVFAVAENEFQSGAASKNTAKSFLHASVFFESMKHFAPLSEETLGRIRYSKWKATEIVNAIAEGRVPGPEGAAERSLDEEMNGIPAGSPMDIPSSPAFGNASYAARLPAASPSPTAFAPAPVSNNNKSLHDSGSDLDLPDVPVFSQSQLSSQRPAQQPGAGAGAARGSPQFSQPPSSSSPSPQFPQVPGPVHPSSNQMAVDVAPGPRPPHEAAHAARPTAGFTNFISSRVVYSPKPVNNSSIDVILEATKFSKNAISALQFDDPETAIKNLRSALRVLTGSDH